MRDSELRGEASRLQVVLYFTGKPCRHGHVAERLTWNGNCVECMRKSGFCNVGMGIELEGRGDALAPGAPEWTLATAFDPAPGWQGRSLRREKMKVPL